MSGKTEKKKRAEKKTAENKKSNEIKLTYRIFSNTIVKDKRPTSFFKIGMSTINNSDLPIPTAIKVDQLIQEVESKGKTFERMRTKLFEKYKSKDGKEKDKIPEDRLEEFEEKFEELLDQEFKITMKKIKLPENLTIKPVYWREIKTLFDI